MTIIKREAVWCHCAQEERVDFNTERRAGDAVQVCLNP